MKKSVIFWDFDGVMADSTPFVFNYWKTSLKARGHDFTPQDYQATFTYKFPFDYLLEHFGDDAYHVFGQYTEYENTHYAESVEPFPQFIEGFKSVAPHFQHFVVSSNLESVIEPWLKKYEIDDFFNQVVGRETPGYKNEKVISLLQENKTSPEAALFIGDTTSDIEHAHKSQVTSIAASWGVHSAAQLTKAKPKFMCEKPADLFKLLSDAHQ